MDYSCEPPSIWASHSHGNPALRARCDAGWLVRPLRLVGGQALSAPPHVGHAEHAFTLYDDRRAEPRGTRYGMLTARCAIRQAARRWGGVCSMDAVARNPDSC